MSDESERLDRFRWWLQFKRKCRPTTVHVYGSCVARVRRNGAAYPEKHERSALRTYVRYLDHARPVEDQADQAIRDWLLEPMPVERGPRKMAVAPFTKDDWAKLRTTLATDPEPEARVLEIQAVTGLRIGDVLRIRRHDLRKALAETDVLHVEIKGGRNFAVPTSGAPEVWHRLHKQWREWEDLAHWISPQADKNPDHAAYVSVRKHLRLLGQHLELDGRVNLHRIRHTVANRALAITKDVDSVRVLLGHRSLQSTMRYLDDRERVDDVAQLHRRLREDL